MVGLGSGVMFGGGAWIFCRMSALADHWYGLSVVGFLTRAVADTALLLEVGAAQPFVEAARRDPGRLRVAVSLKPPAPGPVDAGVRASVERVAEVLRTLGHEVVERDPAYGTAFAGALARYLAGIAQDAERFPRPERLQRRTRGFERLGSLIPGPVVERARREEARHAARIDELFRDHDLLLTPTTATPPVAAAAWEGMNALRTLLGLARAYPFTGIWNMTGQPALSIPAPPAGGLPVGAQLIGPPDSEARLLAVAAQLERGLGWPEHRPPRGP